MPAAPARNRRLGLALTVPCCGITVGFRTMNERNRMWAASCVLTCADWWTCTATSSSGVTIGITIGIAVGMGRTILASRLIRTGLQKARTVSFAAVTGTAFRGIAVRPPATTTNPRTTTASVACVWCGR